MKRLKVWQKLALMGVVFLIPFALVTLKLVSSVDALSIHPTRQEIAGVTYLRELHDVLHHIQERRTLMAAYSSGNREGASRIEEVSDKIREEITRVDREDALSNAELKSTEHWNPVKASIQALIEKAEGQTAAQSFENHSQVIRQIDKLVVYVGETSNLLLDPKTTTFHLMNGTVVYGPAVTETLSQLSAIGTRVVVRGRATPEERREMMRLSHVLEYNVELLDTSLESAIATEPSLQNTLGEPLRVHKATTRRFQNVAQRLIANPRDAFARNNFSSSSEEALTPIFEFLDIVSPTLEKLLNQRIADQEGEVRNTLLEALLGLVVVLVIGAFLMRDITQMTQRMQNMTARLQDQNRKIVEGINVLSASSSQILASTSQVSASATETAAAVTETTATVEEVKQTAQLSSQKARDVAETAQQSAEISYSGTQSVSEMVTGMERIREQMTHIAESVVHLSEQSQAIGDIINTVNDLAEQSNLLAVNAAIEAAKAGEQGKGFAVVAQEVKSLAEQSKQATTQVRTILNEVQKATGSAVMATEQGNKAVEAGLNQAVAAGHSIQSLADSIEGAAHAAMQIAASSQEQLAGVDQVALAMNNIKEASTQNVSSMRQLESAARSLNEVGSEMRQLTEQSV